MTHHTILNLPVGTLVCICDEEEISYPDSNDYNEWHIGKLTKPIVYEGRDKAYTITLGPGINIIAFDSEVVQMSSASLSGIKGKHIFKLKV